MYVCVYIDRAVENKRESTIVVVGLSEGTTGMLKRKRE
jgi:hypothetical protein